MYEFFVFYSVLFLLKFHGQYVLTIFFQVVQVDDVQQFFVFGSNGSIENKWEKMDIIRSDVKRKSLFVYFLG